MPQADVIENLNVSHRYVIIHKLERKHGKGVIDMLTIPRPK